MAKLTAEVLRETVQIFLSNNSNVTKAADEMGIARATLKERLDKAVTEGLYNRNTNAEVFREDKEIEEIHWRELSELAKANQELSKKMTNKQANGVISIKTDLNAILLLPLSDIHIGSNGTCYGVLESITDLVLEHDYMYLSTHGDLADNFVNFFSKAAMFSQSLNPKQQRAFLASWLNDIQHKMLFAAWGNHEEMEEKLTSLNSIADLMSRRVTFLNQIGTVTLRINEVEYDIAVTHKTRYNSSFNETHGLRQLARKDIPNCDIYLTGDRHTPAYSIAWERDREQCYMMTGTFKKHDTYAARYFAPLTHVEFPCLVLNTREKEFSAFSTIEKAMHYCEKMNYE